MSIFGDDPVAAQLRAFMHELEFMINDDSGYWDITAPRERPRGNSLALSRIGEIQDAVFRIVESNPSAEIMDRIDDVDRELFMARSTFGFKADSRRSETKQSGGGDTASIGELIARGISKIASLFRRTEEIQQQEEEGEADDLATEIARANPSRRGSRDAVAMQGVLSTLEEHLERVSAEWENVAAEAERVKGEIEDVNGGIRALTSRFATQYAAQSASALSQQLGALTQQWDELTARAAELRTATLELQEQVRVIEEQIESKAAEMSTIRHVKGFLTDLRAALGSRRASYEQELEDIASERQHLRALAQEHQGNAHVYMDLHDKLGDVASEIRRQMEEDDRDPEKSAKAFWDPEDDEDTAALKERIDDLAERVAAVERGDRRTSDDPESLRAELSDLLDGLTDDTRFRVQALIDRVDEIETKGSGAPGAHHLYK